MIFSKDMNRTAADDRSKLGAFKTTTFRVPSYRQDISSHTFVWGDCKTIITAFELQEGI